MSLNAEGPECAPPTPQRQTLANQKPYTLQSVPHPTARVTIDSLDNACLGHIFAKLDYPLWLLSCQFVCKKWHEVANDPNLWREMFLRHYATSTAIPTEVIQSVCTTEASPSRPQAALKRKRGLEPTDNLKELKEQHEQVWKYLIRKSIKNVKTRYKLLRRDPPDSNVWRARDTFTGSLCAVKVLRSNDDDGVGVNAIREVNTLKLLKGVDGIIRLLGVEACEEEPPDVPNHRDIPETPRLLLAFERMDTNLRKPPPEWTEDDALKPEIVRGLMWQILVGVAGAHSRGVLHRDLKPDNILVDTLRGHARIAGWGLSRAIVPNPQGDLTPEVVTLWYRAPELLLGAAAYSMPVDLWSVGAIFGELASGHPLFPSDNIEIDQLFHIFRILGTPTESCWKGVTGLPNFHQQFPYWKCKDLGKLIPRLCDDGIDLLRHLLDYNPATRYTAKEALRHRYFDGPCMMGGIRYLPARLLGVTLSIDRNWHVYIPSAAEVDETRLKDQPAKTRC
mmetsp:Transcript_6719/g.24869  ORF Transcript_6719/g.24869 Transcript_6719/m.24869 type:complete len:506 (+) Transcript_6719:198-1715(+)